MLVQSSTKAWFKHWLKAPKLNFLLAAAAQVRSGRISDGSITLLQHSSCLPGFISLPLSHVFKQTNVASWFAALIESESERNEGSEEQLCDFQSQPVVLSMLLESSLVARNLNWGSLRSRVQNRELRIKNGEWRMEKIERSHFWPKAIQFEASSIEVVLFSISTSLACSRDFWTLF